MGFQVYQVGSRWGGYGVPAYCDYPGCREEIDRGLAFACGGEPFSEIGCDGYFCSKHKEMVRWDEYTGEWCYHEEDCECRLMEVCERCAKGKSSFEHSQEHPEWVNHLLTDESWAEWRENNPKEVEDLKKKALKD